MLRQIIIVREDSLIYKRNYGKALSEIEINNLLPNLIDISLSKFAKEYGSFEYFKYKISFITEKDFRLIFVFISGLSDDNVQIKTELYKIKKEFLILYFNFLHFYFLN